VIYTHRPALKGFNSWGYIPQTPWQRGTPPLDSPERKSGKLLILAAVASLWSLRCRDRFQTCPYRTWNFVALVEIFLGVGP
jgi:hypothetical protein